MSPLAFRGVVASAVAAMILTACGGGDDGETTSGDPSPRAIPASVTVVGASDTALNGTYSSSTIALNEVTKFNPIGGEPETCRMRFSGLQQSGTTRLMDGDIRYIPGTTETRTTFVSINTIEFRLQGTTGTFVDKPNNRIVYNNAVLTSTQGTNNTITLNGAIPMLPNRPEGC